MRTDITRNLILAGVIALFQLGIIGGMLAKGLHPLWTGDTVEFRTTPLDPRDLLRGQYVLLNYEFSSVSPGNLKHDLKPGDTLLPDTIVYVRLEKNADRWRATELRRTLPRVKEKSASRIYLRGKTRLYYTFRSGTAGYPLRINYGLERYYTDPDRALELEQIAGRNPVKVIVAVTDAGIARIRDIKIDEKKKPRP